MTGESEILELLGRIVLQRPDIFVWRRDLHLATSALGSGAMGSRCETKKYAS